MKNITIIGGFNFNEDQNKRLAVLGKVKAVPSPDSAEEWLKQVQGADIICSDGDFLLENIYNLRNVFVTYPYIELGAFDSEKLRANGVTVANTQGSNRDSIVENVTADVPFERTQSLAGKQVLIVGKGNIGTQIGNVCTSFGMSVDYFERGNDIYAKSEGVDLIVNCLNSSPSSKNLLDEKFFMSLSPGTYFVTFVRPHTYDIDGLIKSLDANILAGAAIDCDPEASGNTTNAFYQKVIKQSKIIVTPHTAFATVQAGQNGTETVVQNIEAYIAGTPKNLVIKK
jgi:phosphoglycerate dehydrogenase-like enzyme